MAILAVNAGSSSLKFSLFPLRHGAVQPSVLAGNVQGLEPQGSPQISWKHQGKSFSDPMGSVGSSASDVFQTALQRLNSLLQSMPDLPKLMAVGHRVVHGGKNFTQCVQVDARVLSDLTALNSLAPLHQPHNVAGIVAFQKAFPTLPNMACFDTAFHATVPDIERQFPLPQELTHQGIRRYGFHGLSYQYIMGALQKCSARANGKVLMAHLGNGASLCMAQAGQSRATTMGFSALDGLMMGTRCGALDPGVLLYLLEQSWPHAKIQNLLYKQSGLLGVSGISADMRQLRADPSDDAQWAIQMFTHRIVRESGALIAGQQGFDVLTFSGGIGEHDAILRAEVCQQLAWLGVQIDASKNAKAIHDQIVPIHTQDSRVEVWVVPTDEERVVAQETAALVLPPVDRHSAP